MFATKVGHFTITINQITKKKWNWALLKTASISFDPEMIGEDHFQYATTHLTFHNEFLIN